MRTGRPGTPLPGDFSVFTVHQRRAGHHERRKRPAPSRVKNAVRQADKRANFPPARFRRERSSAETGQLRRKFFPIFVPCGFQPLRRSMKKSRIPIGVRLRSSREDSGRAAQKRPDRADPHRSAGVFAISVKPIYDFAGQSRSAVPTYSIRTREGRCDSALPLERANFRTPYARKGLRTSARTGQPRPARLQGKLNFDIVTFSNHNELTRHPYDASLRSSVCRLTASNLFKYHKLVFGCDG